MRRQIIPELLDTDSGTAEEIAASLGDLRGINRAFGGFTTTEAMIERVARVASMQSLSFLEVAAGSGEMAMAIQQRLQAKGIDLRVSVLDRAWSHLKNGNGAGGSNKPRAVAGDALALPFRDASFDLVSCNLFAHHLSIEEIIQFGNEALRVCRIAVLVNDLVRSRLHLTFVYAGLPLFRSRITRHDALASVRRAYTVSEMRGILLRSEAAGVEIQRAYLFRMGAIAWKKRRMPKQEDPCTT